MLLDSGGFRWLNETWLKVDRGVKFYDSAAIPADIGFLASRVVFVALGLLAVELSRWHFSARLRGTLSRRAARRGITRPEVRYCRQPPSLPFRSDHWG